MTIDVGAIEGGGLYTGTAPARAPKKELDSETFIHLLVAQLKYQDPSAPMSTNEMMAQTTQLASMEQLTRLTTTMQEQFALTMRDAAANLVGRTVSYIDADGVRHTGPVSAVRYERAMPGVVVGDETVPLEAITEVTLVPGSEPEAGPGTDPGTDPDTDPDTP